MGASVGGIPAGSVGNRQCMVQENSSMSVDKQIELFIGEKWEKVEETYLVEQLEHELLVLREYHLGRLNRQDYYLHQILGHKLGILLLLTYLLQE